MFRLYIGNGNWVNLTREVTDELYEVYQKGKATRYELAPGLLLDIIPNDVDCNSKNTDLACLMRVDLCYDNDNCENNSEEDTQQRMSKYIKDQLEKQGIIDAFPPTKKSDNKLPQATSLPTHRHLSMVPTPPTSVNRRSVPTAANNSSSRTSSKSNHDVLQASSSTASDNLSPASVSNKNRTTVNKKQRKTNKRRRIEKQESPEAGIPTSVGEDNSCSEQLRKSRMGSATDQELQYHYYSLGQHHQHVMLSATPYTYRAHSLSTPYYTTDKSLLLRTPSPPPMLSDLSIDRQYHHHHQNHDHEGSIDSAENNHTFYGTNNVLSHAEEQTYPLLSLSHEPQNWPQTFHSSRSSSIHNHQEQNNNHPMVAAAAAVAVATNGDYEYYGHHQQHDSKLDHTQPYQMVASTLQHQQDPSIHNASVSLSNKSSPQSMLLPPASSEEAYGGFQSNCPPSNRSVLHHQQHNYNEQSACSFMVDSEQLSQD